MHAHFQRADQLSGLVIGAAIEVHRLKGAGLILQRYKSSSGGTWLTDEAFQEPYF